MNKGDAGGWLNAALKITETTDELSTTCNPKVISKCLSEPDATSLHHCLKNKQQGWLNAALKITETTDELSTTCNPKVISKCLSEPDATSLHHCLKNKQL